MKKRLALLCVCLLLINSFLSSLGIKVLFETIPVEAAANVGISTPGQFVAGSGEDSPFGINIQAASRYGIPGQLQIPLDSARGTGATWDREEIRWDMVQKPNGSFDFSLVDEVVNKAAARGINILGLLDYNRDNSKTMPDLGGWNNYVANTVSHFKGRVNYWQVWNEPENGIYMAGASPADYARLLRASFGAIKGANPNAKVVTAGVNGFAVPWLEQMMAAGGEGQYDILAVHPYVRFNTSPESKYWTDNQIAYVTAFSRRHGNKPVWATEFGWTTGGTDGTSVSESAQANYLARSYVSGLASGLSKMLMYQFRDEGNNDSFGLVRQNWTSPKPGYVSYRNLVSRLGGATFRDRVDLFDNTRQVIDDFENSPGWNPFNAGAARADVSSSTEQSHTGTKSLKVSYSLNGDGYIEMGRSGSQNPLSGQPTKVGFWIYGDDTSALFHVLVKGSDGQLFVYEPGKAGGKFWHRLEAFLPGENVYHNGDGILRYPVSFQSIQILRQPDPNELTWGNTIYLDDFYAEEGANVMLYRFDKGGRTLDVVWSDGGGANVNVPTQSAQRDVKAFNRDGNPTPFTVTNSALNFTASDDMVFFEHSAPAFNGAGLPALAPVSGNCGVPSSTVSPSNSFTDQAFQNFWARYDALAPGNRSFVWGGQPLGSGSESYSQAPGGNRKVLYFDKSRMEITNPGGNSDAFGFVTNGLLTVELITGKVQIGDNQDDIRQFTQCPASQVPVAGDNDDTGGPRYSSLAARRADPPKSVGAFIGESIDAVGRLGASPAAGQYNVTAGYFEPVTNHTIARPFWDFLNDSNQKIMVNGQVRTGKLFDPYYAAPGLPITEAYWARVKVGGEVKDVLIQAFERRVLTYTPSNPPAFQVEWGNIGRHYYTWRYGSNP